MKITKFKNGNFNVKFDENSHDLLDDLCNERTLDFQIAGDEGCASNYDMYYPLYNSYTGLMYLITGQDCQDYADGLTVKLVGRNPDGDELEDLLSLGLI